MSEARNIVQIIIAGIVQFVLLLITFAMVQMIPAAILMLIARSKMPDYDLFELKEKQNG